MKSTEGKKVFTCLLFICLIFSANTLFWQGTGNMSQSNLTFIWNYIHANFNKSKTHDDITTYQKTYLSDFTTNFSTLLNNQWAPAWNVVMTTGTTFNQYDAVVYGYAFRDHWMWYNAYLMQDQNQYVTFIIWKDYNCNTWVTLNPQQNFSNNPKYFQGNLESAIIDIANSKKSSFNYDDIWSMSKMYSQELEANSNFPSSAFSVIVSQMGGYGYYGRFCVVGFYIKTYLGPYDEASALIMQMR